VCGRYWLVTPFDVLTSRFRVQGERIPLEPRWNAAPGQDLPVVVAGPGGRGRLLKTMRWGLVPAWVASPDDAGRPINARAETAAGKPSFQEPFRSRRALVPADGFFEWRKDERRREPWGIRLASREPFAFAGLWDAWRPRGGAPLETFVILTTRPNAKVAALHDRMPVILAPDDEDLWLDTGAHPERLERLFEPPPDESLETFRVSPRVNSPANDDPSVLEPPGTEPPGRTESGPKEPRQASLWENDDDGEAS
jgi:putative SOS response-associated peptidase YedK